MLNTLGCKTRLEHVYGNGPVLRTAFTFGRRRLDRDGMNLYDFSQADPSLSLWDFGVLRFEKFVLEI